MIGRVRSPHFVAKRLYTSKLGFGQPNFGLFSREMASFWSAAAERSADAALDLQQPRHSSYIQSAVKAGALQILTRAGELLLERGNGGGEARFVIGPNRAQIQKHTIIFNARYDGRVELAKSFFDLIWRELRMGNRD